MRNRISLFLILCSVYLPVACTKKTDAPSTPESVKVPEVVSLPGEGPSRPKVVPLSYASQLASMWEIYCSGLDYKLQQRKVRSVTELEHSQRSEIFFLDQKSAGSIDRCWDELGTLIPISNRAGFLENSSDDPNQDNLIKFKSAMQYSVSLFTHENLKIKSVVSNDDQKTFKKILSDRTQKLLNLGALHLFSHSLNLHWPIMILQNPLEYRRTELMSVPQALLMAKKKPLKHLEYFKHLVTGLLEAIDVAIVQQSIFTGDLLIAPTIAVLSEMNNKSAHDDQFKTSLRQMLLANPEFGTLLFNTLVIKTAKNSVNFSVTDFNRAVQDPSGNPQEMLDGLPNLVSVQKCKVVKAVHCFTFDNVDGAPSPLLEFPVSTFEEAMAVVEKGDQSEPLTELQELQNYWDGILKDLEAFESGKSAIGIFGRYLK